MFALLSPRLWLALALAAALAVSHFMVFRAGKAVVRQEWDREKTERMAKAVTDSESARLRERVMRKEAEDVDAKFQAAKAARLALDRVAADRLLHISDLTTRLDRAADLVGEQIGLTMPTPPPSPIGPNPPARANMERRR